MPASASPKSTACTCTPRRPARSLAIWAIPAITVAASLANAAVENRHLAGLYANTSLPNSDQPIRIPPSRNPEQLTLILEALAKVLPFPIAPLENFLAAESGRLPWGATLVIVSAVLSEGLLSTLLKLRDAGHRLLVTALGDTVSTDTMAGIKVWHISPSEI